MNKVIGLKKLAAEIEHCADCKKDSTGKMVFGEGDPDAKIMFVGEAPGKNEAETGRPFIGRSGKYLRSLIRNILNLNEKDVYITSPVKYLPKRGTPSKKQIDTARPFFMKQLTIIKPKVIVLLGKTAVAAVLNQDISILKEHGSLIDQNNKIYFITLHPAAAIRFAKFRSTIASDFDALKIITAKLGWGSESE